MDNQTIVFTGHTDSISKFQLTELANQAGFDVTGAVNKTTALVVYGKDCGSKVDKAEMLNIKRMPVSSFVKLARERIAWINSEARFS